MDNNIKLRAIMVNKLCVAVNVANVNRNWTIQGIFLEGNYLNFFNNSHLIKMIIMVLQMSEICSLKLSF